MEPVIIKTIVILVTLILSLVFGLITLKLVGWMQRTDERERRLNTILSFLTCFSGGTFLGLVLIHLLPEVTEDFNESLESNGVVTEYPFAFLVVCFGLFLVLFLEKIVIECKANRTNGVSEKDYTVHGSEQKHHNSSIENGVFQSGNGERTSLLARTEPNSNQGMPQSSVSNYMAIGDTGRIETLPADDNTIEPTKSSSSSADDSSLKITSIIRSGVLLMALAFHSIFAGLAVGLQLTETKIIALFIAIDTHKFVVAFSLGLEMAQTDGMLPRTRIFFMIAFSLMTPIGIAIGMLIVDTGGGEDHTRQLVSSVLQALATGTFMYVTFFEILQKELNTKRSYDVLRVLMILIGFGFMAGNKGLDA